MSFKVAAEMKRLREEARQDVDGLIVLEPIDPIRRAKRDQDIPAPEPGDTPNGTAKAKEAGVPVVTERKSTTRTTPAKAKKD